MRMNPLDPRISWHGAVSLEQGDDWVRPWRIPFNQRLLFGRPEGTGILLQRAAMPSGVRIAFMTDSRSVGIDVEPVSIEDDGRPQAARVDFWCDGELRASLPLLG